MERAARTDGTVRLRPAPGIPGAAWEDEPVSVARQAVRDLRHLVTGTPAVALALLLALAGALGAALSVVGVGLPLLDRALAGIRVVLDRHRRRVAGGTPHTPYRPVRGSLTARLRIRLADPATGRDLLFALTHPFLAVAGAVVPVVVWLAAVPGLALPLLHEVRPDLVEDHLAIPGYGAGTAWLACVAALLVAAAGCRLPRAAVHLEERLIRTLLRPTAVAPPVRPGADDDRRPTRAVLTHLDA
ncbi:sensor domain-containing protein [Micromonospora endolithica]|uniref:sensor domain-containing protein n=1 Tax=Micromonospora endolithica TaxID=230091 RepID=UPI0011AC6E1B|nr:sensor domain-containing protein [Micromonospora endolithica]TWJ24088.1 putative sensor protein [Micromonospora endolithica]